MQTTSQSSTPTKPNWPHVAGFLGLTFGLTWLVDLALYLNGGLANPGTMLLLQFQMLLPAFSAIFLGAFFFKESPLIGPNPTGLIGMSGLIVGAVILFSRLPRSDFDVRRK